jgi:hypothetical protein
MPEREFSPRVLVFYAEPYGPDQYQNVYFKQLANDVTVTPEESCKSWLLSNNDQRFAAHARGVGVAPGGAGAFTCSAAMHRAGAYVGSIRVYMNVGASANLGTTSNIAAPARPRGRRNAESPSQFDSA